MGKILVIGAAGLIGAEVVKALGEARASARRAVRTTGRHLGPKSLAALFARIGMVDGIICTGGAARFKPWDQLTDEDWTFSLANKLLGQVNVVRYGANCPARRRDHADDGSRVAISRLRAARSSPPSTTPSTLLFARRPRSRRFPCGSTPFRRAGSRRHCRRWAAIRPAEFLRPTWPRSPSGNFARARQVGGPGGESLKRPSPRGAASVRPEGGFSEPP